MLKTLTLSTKNKYELVDLTEQINQLIFQQNIDTGFCLIHAPHATVGLFLDEYEPNLNQDFIKTFQDVIPPQKFQHDKIDNNAKSHLLSALYGTSLTIIIENKKLVLGKYQHILFAEFDGPRQERQLIIKIVNSR